MDPRWPWARRPVTFGSGPVRCPLPTVTPGGGRDAYCCVSGPRRRRARPASVPVAVAGEVVPGHPALCRPGLPVAGIRRAERGRVLRDPVHRPVLEGDLRLQRRGAPLDLAGTGITPPGASRCAPHPRLPAAL